MRRGHFSVTTTECILQSHFRLAVTALYVTGSYRHPSRFPEPTLQYRVISLVLKKKEKRKKVYSCTSEVSDCGCLQTVTHERAAMALGEGQWWSPASRSMNSKIFLTLSFDEKCECLHLRPSAPMFGQKTLILLTHEICMSVSMAVWASSDINDASMVHFVSRKEMALD